MLAYDALAEISAIAELGAEAIEPYDVAIVARTIGERALEAEEIAKGVLLDGIRQEVPAHTMSHRPDHNIRREEYGSAILPVGTKVETQAPDGQIIQIGFTEHGIIWNDRRGKMDAHALFVLSTLLRFHRLRFSADDFLRAGFHPTHPEGSARHRRFSQTINGLKSDIQTTLSKGQGLSRSPIEVTKREDGNLYAWDYPVELL
jgi:hypothetical protein